MMRIRDTGLATILLLAVAAVPAQAQSAAGKNKDGTFYCDNTAAEATVRTLTDGDFALNYSFSMFGTASGVHYARGAEGMFDETPPSLSLFYSARMDSKGKMEDFSAITVSADLGIYVPGRERPEDGLTVLIEAGGLRSPALKLSTTAIDDNGIGAVFAAPSNSIDDRDVEGSWEGVDALAAAIAENGATLSVMEKGLPIASVQIPARDVARHRAGALAYSARALPLLKQGKCPA